MANYYESLRCSINYLIADKQNRSSNFKEEAKLNDALKIILSKGCNEDAPVSLAAVYSSFDVSSPTLAYDLFSNECRKKNILDLLLFEYTKDIATDLYISLKVYNPIEKPEDIQIELVEQIRKGINEGKIKEISKAYLDNAKTFYYDHSKKYYKAEKRGSGEVPIQLDKAITLSDGNEVPFGSLVADSIAEIESEKLFYEETLHEVKDFLTDREIKILVLSENGYSNNEIALFMEIGNPNVVSQIKNRAHKKVRNSSIKYYR